MPKLPDKKAPQQRDPRAYFVRDRYVVLDRDVASYFGVSTKALNQAINRNKAKFAGSDFAFRLTAGEWTPLRSQLVTSAQGRGGDRYVPNVLTEKGVALAATILRSPRAIEATRFIAEVFVEARKSQLATLPSGKSRTELSDQSHIPLSRRIRNALVRLADAIVHPDNISAATREASTLASEAISALREYLRRPGIENQVRLKEIEARTLAAETIKIENSTKRTDNKIKQIELAGRKLRLIQEARAYAGLEDAEDLLMLLEDRDPDNKAAS